jgi:hypothetical protein
VRSGALPGEGGSVCRLADYLDEHGRSSRAGQIPPPEFWAAAAAHASPEDQAMLGIAAHDRGLYRDAAQLHKNAAAAGIIRSAIYLPGRRAAWPAITLPPAGPPPTPISAIRAPWPCCWTGCWPQARTSMQPH